MIAHEFTPHWRSVTEVVTVYEGLTLPDVEDDPRYKHEGAWPVAVRFCVTDSGRILAADAWVVLHKDICSSAIGIGEHGALLAGICIMLPTQEWEVRTQGFDTRKPQELLGRLSTWADFVRGSVWRFVPYGIEDV